MQCRTYVRDLALPLDLPKLYGLKRRGQGSALLDDLGDGVADDIAALGHVLLRDVEGRDEAVGGRGGREWGSRRERRGEREDDEEGQLVERGKAR